MMYTYYNPNPNGATVGDCVVRALCKAFVMDWDKCFSELVAYAYWLKDMPSANRVWGKLLSDKGYHRKICDCDCTVAEFAEEHTDAGLPRLEREEALREEAGGGEVDDREDQERHAEGRLRQQQIVCSCKRCDIEDEECDRYDEHGKYHEEHEPAACGMGLLFDTHG